MAFRLAFNKKSLKTAAGLVLVLVVLVMLYKRFAKKEGFSNAVTVTYFFLPNCPHCKDFRPEWDKYVTQAKKEGVQTREVDGSDPKNATTVSQKGIKGYPTVLVTKDGKDVEFDKERTSDALAQFVKALGSGK